MLSIQQTAEAADDEPRDEKEAVQPSDVAKENVAAQNAEADEATRKEHDLSVKAAIKLYTKAIMFSLIFSLAVIMEGYDTSLMGTFFGFTPFLDKYGDQLNPESPGSRIVSARWQTIITVGAQVGSVIGLCINGWTSEKIGLRKTMLVSLVLMIASTFIPFFAKNLRDLLIGAIFQGLPWGVFQALAPTYASEVMPVVLRPYSTAYVNLCWLFGQLTAAGVLRGSLAGIGQWAYRIPFAIQWAWPVPILIGTVLAPESPWWLCRRGRDADARNALRRLTSQDCGVPFDVDAQVAMMNATNQLEMETNEDQSYLACFRGTNLRRTEVASMAWVAQASCGAGLMGFSVQLYKQAGLSEHNSFNFNLAQYSIGIIGSVGSWLLMKHVGRRKIYLCGFSIMFVLLLAVGICGVAPRSDTSAYGAGSLLLVYTFFYNFTVGSIGYSLVSEIPSTRLKNSTVALARCAYNISNIIVSVLLPRMLSPKAWNWGAKTGFFWAGACALLFIWSYFRLPEPKDRINWELDVLFERKISARKFARTEVDRFSKKEAEPDMMAPTNGAGSGKQIHTKHEEGVAVNSRR